MIYDLHMADKGKKEHDFSVTAFRVVQEATGQTEPEENQLRIFMLRLYVTKAV